MLCVVERIWWKWVGLHIREFDASESMYRLKNSSDCIKGGIGRVCFGLCWRGMRKERGFAMLNIGCH